MLSDIKHNPLGRFDGLASTYAKYRPGYPAQSLDWIVEKLPERNGLIADVGAGTGIFSRLLAEYSCRIVGIEPNESMRLQAEAIPHPNIVGYRAGRAEATGLEASSVSAVVAAQAFHWCVPEASLREFHRILVPNGWVTLIWNDFDIDDPFTGGYCRLQGECTPEPEIIEKPQHLTGAALLSHSHFDQGTVRTTPNAQPMNENGLLGRAFSASFAPRECQAADRFTRRLRQLFEEHAVDGQLRLLYRTILYQARRAL